MKFITFGATKGFGNSSKLTATSGLPKVKKPRSLAVLILANMVPIAGVLFFGWSLFEVLYLYLLESVVIGLYNVPKIAMVRASAKDRVRGIFSFLGMYGIFIGAEFLGLAALFGGSGETMLPGGEIPKEAFQVFVRHADVVIVALATLCISHGVSFYANFLRKKEYLVSTLEEQKQTPFRRVFVMHFTVGLGSFLSSKLGSPIPTLVLLGLLKMAFDANAHTREHARIAARRTDIPSSAEMQKLLDDSKAAIDRKYPKGGIFPRILKLFMRAATHQLSVMHRKTPENTPTQSSSEAQSRQ